MKINLTIDRFENEKAILKTGKGENIIWSKDSLPENIKEGDIIIFDISKETEAAEDKKSSAKEILNELLNTNND